MKKTILIFAALLSLAFFSFTVLSDHSAARARRINGVIVFTDCEPVSDFRSLGVVKYSGTFAMSNQYSDVRDALISRALKQYPDADAVIFSFTSGSADKCEVIKFKE